MSFFHLFVNNFSGSGLKLHPKYLDIIYMSNKKSHFKKTLSRFVFFDKIALQNSLNPTKKRRNTVFFQISSVKI